MAISKILNMKDCGGHFHGKHLKRSLDYVMNPEKTQDGRLVGAINCQVDSAFEQMKATKRKFGKVDKRQGYHIILSFKEDEVNPDTAFEITRRFVEEYLGKSYEAVYVVHDNTAHVHSHIVFNSVSFVDGKKYRYEKAAFTIFAPVLIILMLFLFAAILHIYNGKTILLTQLIGNWLDILCPVTFLIAILFPIHKAYTVKYNV